MATAAPAVAEAAGATSASASWLSDMLHSGALGYMIDGGIFMWPILLLAVIAYASIRWPRAVLVLVALSAILDRYVVAGLLPASYGVATHITSETLLGIVGLVLAAKALREERFFPALRHPATAFLLAFVVLAAISTLVNRAPIAQGAAGMIFTVCLHSSAGRAGRVVRPAFAAKR